MFEELRAFVAVAEEKSFTKAAKRVAFSQPTVSQQVKRLEIFFNGTDLFERSGAGNPITLTPSGELVYEGCREILEIVDRTTKQVEACKPAETKHLRVGASRTVGSHMVPIVFRKFLARHPHVSVTITVGNTKRICTLLEQEKLDIGLIEGRDVYFSFLRKNFYQDHMILVAAPTVAKRIPYVNAAVLSRLTWIIRERGSGTRQTQLDYFASKSIHATRQIECNSNSANIELACQGLGVTMLSALSVWEQLKSGRLVEIPMEKEIYRYFSYLIKEDFLKREDPTIKDLLQVLDEINQSGSPEELNTDE